MTFEHLALASVCVACLSVGLLAGIWLATPRPRLPAHPVLRAYAWDDYEHTRIRLRLVEQPPYDQDRELRAE